MGIYDGGVTSHGHDIVVAVLDKGFISIIRLKDNLFWMRQKFRTMELMMIKMGILMMSMELTMPPVAGLLRKLAMDPVSYGNNCQKGNNSRDIRAKLEY